MTPVTPRDPRDPPATPDLCPPSCPVLLVVGDNSPHKDAMVSDVTGDVTGPPVMSPGLL